MNMNIPFQLSYPSLVELPQEASFKKTFIDENSGYIWQWLSSHEEFNKTLAVYHQLNSLWPLPRIVQVEAQSNLIIMENGGSDLQKNHDSLIHLKVLLHLVKGHELTNINLPSYTEQEVIRELDIFYEWFIDAQLGIKEREHYDQLKERFIVFFNDSPKVIAHRDFHSKNIMMNQDRIFFIDYQDALIAPYCYDFVSLLEDAYRNLSSENRIKTLEVLNNIAKGHDRNLIEDYQISAEQRLLKMIGIFARLSLRDKKTRYLSYQNSLLVRLLNLTKNQSTLNRFFLKLFDKKNVFY